MVRVAMAEHLRISSQHLGRERRSASSGSGSSTSTDSPRHRAPMGIPNIRGVEAPPPLPPPRYIEDLAQGNDLSWELQNRGEEFGPHRKLAPIKQSSSLFGGYVAPRRGGGGSGHHDDDDEGVDMMDFDDDYDRKGSTSTVRPPSQAELDTASLAVGRMQSLAQRPPSPLGGSNQRLHGERPLAQQNLSRSSHAYDKHLLSKIGKPSSPPRRHNSDCNDSAVPLAQRGQTLNAREAGLSPLSVADSASTSADHMCRWVTSPPTSAGVSPALRHPWRDSAVDYRSPSVDDSAPHSVVDRDFYPRLREGSRHQPSGHEHTLSQASRSNRGSYDQAMCADPETDPSIDDNGTFRKLSLGESRFSLAVRQDVTSKSGMKRRALSPPTDMVREDKVPAHASEPHQRVTPNFAASSPNTQFLKYGSVSSTASSVRPESYTSSAGLSVAGSSMTSISSYPGHSPARLSPSAEVSQDLPYVAAIAPSKPVLSITTSKNAQDRVAYEGRPPHITHIMSNRGPADDQSRPSAASRLTGHYICECCPKKPKKFDTEHDLRLHETEKQYSCQYCNNRFKNKNEAERHQNSLHLRRHSWSCAAIAGYEAAFHPSTSAAAQTPTGPISDACGYCGEEFPNHPQPDWQGRLEHLTNVHKFGECNQSKKFFRADHFRQHLKHSHAGRSGKWTNMLESACMRDEPPDLGTQSKSSPGETSTRTEGS